MKRITIVLAGLIIISLPALCQVTGIKADTIKTRKSIVIEGKMGEKPMVLIDGKEYDPEILDLLDPDKIEKVDVYKGETAMEKYKADNVVSITTRKAVAKETGTRIVVRGVGSLEKEPPVIVIDGNLSSQEALKELSPEKILSIQVLKDGEAQKRYNSTTGVIIIKTKKKE